MGAKGIVCQHLTVARVAEDLSLSWNTANDAVLAEGSLLKGIRSIRRALFFIELGSHGVCLADVTAHSTGSWVTQQARDLFMDLGDRVDRLCLLIRDRDAKFVAGFDTVFTPRNRSRPSAHRYPRLALPSPNAGSAQSAANAPTGSSSAADT